MVRHYGENKILIKIHSRLKVRKMAVDKHVTENPTKKYFPFQDSTEHV